MCPCERASLASFAYVLHLEFPEPGMHAFEKMFDGPMHKWLLWDQQWMIRQLYRLREAGLLSKVSEIDRLRQFTTKYTLADAVQRIVALPGVAPMKLSGHEINSQLRQKLEMPTGTALVCRPRHLRAPGALREGRFPRSPLRRRPTPRRSGERQPRPARPDQRR